MKSVISKITSVFQKPTRMLDEATLNEYLEQSQFIRYVMYRDIWQFVNKEFHGRRWVNPRMVEFGGSNTLIKAFFSHSGYEIAANYPEVDLLELKGYADNTYDFAVLDQVLEHVEDPVKALKEIHRVLKKNGWLICTTPFLIQIHNYPSDYWRFTKEGMKKLLKNFSEVKVQSWGNRKTVIYHLQCNGWPTAREIRAQGYFDLTNEEDYPCVLWSYAKK
ncbi:MAG TPA: class I SAM-dependent methyltransferase [Chitinophagales bacterium]|nr:class I SAM-dependent methyltransferase [Chitinophagales bacterium]